jgi:hypothetical protein
MQHEARQGTDRELRRYRWTGAADSGDQGEDMSLDIFTIIVHQLGH